MNRRFALAGLAVIGMFSLTACPLPPINAICDTPGKVEKRGSEWWECRIMAAETENGKPVSRWFKMNQPLPVLPPSVHSPIPWPTK